MQACKVFIKSFGCSTNVADGEVLAGCLAKAGYDLTETNELADVIIYNTCAVKQPTEDRIIELLKNSPSHKKLIVSGCLPLINFNRLQREVSFNGVTGPAVGSKIVDVLKLVLRGKKVIMLEKSHYKPNLNLPRIRENPIVSIIPINYGCLGTCSYCCVTFSRGHLRSYTIKEIKEKIIKDLEFGVQEFWLTSQDTACYGMDINTSLPKLLRTLCNINGNFRLRVGMMNPNMVKRILEKLVTIYENEKIYKFLHLPVQSGDDAVLNRMRRQYSIDDFKAIVGTFKEAIPQLTLATDIICGFPGENLIAFKRSLQLIEEIQPDIVNISKFFPRPKTAAADMQKDFIPLQEVKRRSRLTAERARKVSYKRNQQWISWTGKILINEIGKVTGSYIGRNFAYKPVVLKDSSQNNLLGKTFHVRIVKAFETHLEGEIIH
ncbi:MAG: tRNA (N(6)-L-threonylcarbamoyladenosine(37)-C(2))-methylthiotransferase [Candidatus Bathyarchaeota archaeon]|jgi:MiaB-like tRNA modifying enzyme